MSSEDAKAVPNHRSEPGSAGSGFGERLAALEAKMDFVATREDIAVLRREIATSTSASSALIANREASMQRWLLGIISAALASVVIALLRRMTLDETLGSASNATLEPMALCAFEGERRAVSIAN